MARSSAVAAFVGAAVVVGVAWAAASSGQVSSMPGTSTYSSSPAASSPADNHRQQPRQSSTPVLRLGDLRHCLNVARRPRRQAEWARHHSRKAGMAFNLNIMYKPEQ